MKVTETIPQEKGWNGWLHIAMAPTKNMDRTEWFTEKATEIGFDELSFPELPLFRTESNQEGTY